MFVTVDQLKNAFPEEIVDRVFDRDDEEIRLFISKIEEYMPQDVKTHLSDNPLACSRFMADCFYEIEEFKYAESEAVYNNSRGYLGFWMKSLKSVAEFVCGSFDYDWLFKDYNWQQLLDVNPLPVAEQAEKFSAEAVNFGIAFGRLLYDHSAEAVEAYVVSACDMKRYVVESHIGDSLAGGEESANGLLDCLSPLFDVMFPLMGNSQYQYFCNDLYDDLLNRSYNDASYGYAAETLMYAIASYFQNRQIKESSFDDGIKIANDIALENLEAIQFRQVVTQKAFLGIEVIRLEGVVRNYFPSMSKVDGHKTQIRLGIAKMKVEAYQLLITANEKTGNKKTEYYAKADRALQIAECIERDTDEFFGTPEQPETDFNTGKCKDYEQKVSDHLSKGNDLLRDNSAWRALSTFCRNAVCCVCTLIVGYPLYLWATRDSRTTLFLDYDDEANKSESQKAMDAVEREVDQVVQSSGLGV